jgi:hypothetical protein
MAATAHRHHAASGWVGGRRGKRRGGEAVVAACARQGDMPKKSVYEHEAKEANMFGKGATLGVVWARASVGGGCRSSAVQTTRRFIGSRRDMWLWPPTRHASRGGLSHRRGGNNEHARKKKCLCTSQIGRGAFPRMARAPEDSYASADSESREIVPTCVVTRVPIPHPPTPNPRRGTRV